MMHACWIVRINPAEQLLCHFVNTTYGEHWIYQPCFVDSTSFEMSRLQLNDFSGDQSRI